MRQIRFDNHLGEKLAGTLDEPGHLTGKGLVLGHCFTCSRHTRILSDLSRDMAAEGYTALRFDFSGNGQSEGDFEKSTYSKQIRELQCAVNHLQAKGVSEIILAGHSMGGTVALLAAAQTKGITGAIALSVGIALLDSERVLSKNGQEILVEKGEVAFLSRGRNLTLTTEFFNDAAGYDLVGSIAKITCPVLLIYGGRDRMIDPDSGRVLKSARPSGIEVFTVPEADHMFVEDRHRETVIDHVVKWVKAL
jgi:uncharacterized protein